MPRVKACSHSRACWWSELTQVYEPGGAEAGPSMWDGQDPSLGSSWGGLQPGFPTSVQGRKDNVTGTSARDSTPLKTESWRHLQKVTQLLLAVWVTSDTTPTLLNPCANTLGSKHQPPLSAPEIKPQPIFLEIGASLPLAGVMVVNVRSCSNAKACRGGVQEVPVPAQAGGVLAGWLSLTVPAAGQSLPSWDRAWDSSYWMCSHSLLIAEH